jgi:hypothetical protein
MGPRSWLALALVLILSASISASCGNGGEPSAAEKLAQWASKWADDVERGAKPNEFRVPPPPRVNLPTVADTIGGDVDSSATEFSSDINVTLDQTKRVFCTWFDWYLNTGNVVPDDEQFGH